MNSSVKEMIFCTLCCLLLGLLAGWSAMSVLHHMWTKSVVGTATPGKMEVRCSDNDHADMSCPDAQSLAGLTAFSSASTAQSFDTVATYVASGYVKPPPAATDIAVITGNVAKTVIINRVSVHCLADTPANLALYLIERSSPDIGGYGVPKTGIQLRGSDPDAFSEMQFIAGHPTLGKWARQVANETIAVGTNDPSISYDIYTWRPNNRDGDVVLRGSSHQLAVNIAEASIKGLSCAVEMTWVEGEAGVTAKPIVPFRELRPGDNIRFPIQLEYTTIGHNNIAIGQGAVSDDHVIVGGYMTGSPVDTTHPGTYNSVSPAIKDSDSVNRTGEMTVRCVDSKGIELRCAPGAGAPVIVTHSDGGALGIVGNDPGMTVGSDSPLVAAANSRKSLEVARRLQQDDGQHPVYNSNDAYNNAGKKADKINEASPDPRTQIEFEDQLKKTLLPDTTIYALMVRLYCLRLGSDEWVPCLTDQGPVAQPPLDIVRAEWLAVTPNGVQFRIYPIRPKTECKQDQDTNTEKCDVRVNVVPYQPNPSREVQ